MNPLAVPYTTIPRGGYPAVPTPLLPADVTFNGVTLRVTGMLDTGAMMSVIPHSVGARFGASWSSLTVPTLIGGVGGGVPAKLVTASGVIGTFPPIPLVFAWAASDDVPTVFGYLNFFLEFDVCFFATRGQFTVVPRTP